MSRASNIILFDKDIRALEPKDKKRIIYESSRESSFYKNISRIIIIQG